MPDTDKVTIVKNFSYRGQTEEWSNTYHLDGTTPTTPVEWKTLYDAIILSEKPCWHAGHKAIRAYGYEAGSEVANDVYDYLATSTTVPGTLPLTTILPWAGDQAGWIRAKRTGNSGTGKSVFIRKYFHGGGFDPGYPDLVAASLKTAYVTHGTKMLSGTLPGSMVWVAPQGQHATLPAASPFVTTRTLKRRGKRPTV